MKKLIFVFAMMLGWASPALATQPASVTSLRAIHALSNEEAGHGLPVAFEAVVTYFRSSDSEHSLFVQDGGVAIFVIPPNDLKLAQGDRVLVKGTTRPSFRPFIAASSISVLRHSGLPKPLQANFDTLIGSKHDCELVKVRGIVLAAKLIVRSKVSTTELRIRIDGGIIDAVIDSNDAGPINDLLDAEVEVVGATSGSFDGKTQQTGIVIRVQSLAGLKVLNGAATKQWFLPVTPMDKILTHYHINDLSQRVRVSGTITYYQPGSAIVLQNGPESLWINTDNDSPVKIGDLADVTGFPDGHDGVLTLNEGNVRDRRVQGPVTPVSVKWGQLSTLDRHNFDLVSIEGQVVTEVRKADLDEYVLESGGRLFSAIYKHPVVAGMFPLTRRSSIPLESKIRVSGIYNMQSHYRLNHAEPFIILLRSPDDIAVIENPSLLSIRNLLLALGLLLVVVMLVGLRAWALERNLHRQTDALAGIERRRCRILEDISGSRPLAEILEEITGVVSLKLNGAPCWCQLTAESLQGKNPATPGTLRVVRETIPARSGPPLGQISAGLDPSTKPDAGELEALRMGASLATLAIETRRLNSELKRRSESDFLTDINNRFSFEKRLDAQVEAVRLNGGVLGLIYIDLDKFKEVNDAYGHLVGDTYLQEISLRMKRQLRPGDLLARLGGDEFAVLVSSARSRSDVEEIAQRLEHCFGQPFAIAEFVLRGTASMGIALYPEDGTTRDSLLNAADAAMYTAKHNNRREPCGSQLTECDAK